MNNQVDYWKASAEYQALISKMRVDAYVGLKNGVSIAEVQKAVELLCEDLKKSLKFKII
jgi:hypothetical protein